MSQPTRQVGVDARFAALRRWLWTLVTFAVVATRDRRRPLPAPIDEPVEPMPIGKRYPGLGDAPIAVAADTPGSERPGWVVRVLIRATLWLREVLPLADERCLEPGEGVYPGLYRWLGPAPVRHPAAIADLAQSGPFSLYTVATPGGFELTATAIAATARHGGYARCGGSARLVRAGTGLLTTRVEVGGASAAPGEPGFDDLQRRFLSGLGTRVTVMEHLVAVHLITAGSVAIAARSTLPASHPWRALLQPFVVEVVRLVNDHVDGLVATERSHVPRYSAVPLSAVDDWVRLAAREFDFAAMNPERRARGQGTLGVEAFVTVADAVRLYRALHRVAVAAVGHGVDGPVRAFAAAVDAMVPNGAARALGYASVESLGPEGLAELLAIAMYTSSVGHYCVAGYVRDVQLDFDAMPPAVTDDGRPTLGTAFDKLDAVLVAGIRRYDLLGAELPPVPAPIAQAWTTFQADLRTLEAEVATDPAPHRRIQPSRIPSSAHA